MRSLQRARCMGRRHAAPRGTWGPRRTCLGLFVEEHRDTGALCSLERRQGERRHAPMLRGQPGGRRGPPRPSRWPSMSPGCVWDRRRGMGGPREQRWHLGAARGGPWRGGQLTPAVPGTRWPCRSVAMVQIGKKAAAGPKKGKKALTFTIDCSKPVEDKVRGEPRRRQAAWQGGAPPPLHAAGASDELWSRAAGSMLAAPLCWERRSGGWNLPPACWSVASRRRTSRWPGRGRRSLACFRRCSPSCLLFFRSWRLPPSRSSWLTRSRCRARPVRAA